MRRLRKAVAGLTALFIVFCLLSQIFGVSSVYAEEAVPTAMCRPYTGTSEAYTTITSAGSRIRIVDDADPDYGKYIAYCLEASKKYPEVGSHVRYCWYDDSASDGNVVLQTMDNPRDGADEALWNLKTTLWNGYPLNYDYLHRHFDVTQEEAEWITQMAVHYWSDSWYTIYGDGRFDDGPRANKELRDKDRERKDAGRPLLWDLFNFLVGKAPTTDTQEELVEPSFDSQWLIGIPQGNENYVYQRIVALQPNQHDMEILKTDENGTLLEGAEFHFEKIDAPSHSAHIVDGGLENYVVDWSTTDMNPYKVFPPAGTYRLTETKTPAGYEAIPEIIVKINGWGKFEVVSDQGAGHVQAEGSVLKVSNSKIYVPPTPTVSFAKVAEGAQSNQDGTISQLEGAWLKVVQGADKNGYELPGGSNWFSTGTAKSFQMSPGIYTFVEISAPWGYKKADPIVFQISQNGKIQIRQPDDTFGPELEDLTITMVDPVTSYEVQFQKQDVNGKMLSGAEIQILDFTTKAEVAKWQSDGTVWKTSLKPGQYIFHEEYPPTGYESVGDIAFTVAMDGKVTIDSKMPDDQAVVEGENKLIVTDKEEPGDVTVKKVVTGKGGNSSQYFRFVMQTQKQNDLSAISGAFPITVDNPDDLTEHQEKDSTLELEENTLTFDENGQAVFYLKHGQSLTVKLPKQTLIKVEEIHDGSYTTTAQVVGTDPLKEDRPEQVSFVLDTDHPVIEVDYENNKEMIVPTGIRLDRGALLPVFIGTFFVAAGMLLASTIGCRHRKSQRKVSGDHGK